MTARPSIAIPPAGDSAQRVADKLRIADQWVLQEYTPSSASDATAPGVRFAFDGSYFYVQLSTGVWRRTAHASW